MFDCSPMLAPVVPSMSMSLGSSDHLTFHHDKVHSDHLCFGQPYTVQIIQLVEGPPPPPRRITASVIDDSSASSYSSEYSDSSSFVSDEDDEEEESVCSSYCSSDDELPLELPQSEESTVLLPAESSTESYSIRMKRILAWRENFSAALSTTLTREWLSPDRVFLCLLTDVLCPIRNFPFIASETPTRT